METAPSIPTGVDAPTMSGQRHRAWLAAVLSFVFPGLGQAYAGRPRLAALLALPVVLLIGAGLVIVGVLGGTLRNALLSSGFLTAVSAANVLLLAWRVFAIWHAGLSQPPLIPRRERRAATVAVGLLLVTALAMHGWAGLVVAQLDGTLTQVFGREPTGPVGGPGDPTPSASQDGSPSASQDGGQVPVNQPGYRWDGQERINVLLLGSDAAPGREHILTDVILVLSADPVEGTAVMISVPRDTGFLPLPDESIHTGGLYPAKANELATVAAAHPELWCPGMEITAVRCGIQAVERSVGLYVGLDIHHYALVDMAGFAELIDALGGVDLCLEGRLVDAEFDGTLSNEGTEPGLVLPAGCHHYNGIDALAYARSRQGYIEMADGTRVQQTDFDRNERQQAVLLALRRELASGDLLFSLPDVLGAIGRTVSTDFPRDQAGDLATLLPLITGPDIERVVLGYPEYVDLPLEPEVNYLLIPRRDAIREEMAGLFGADALQGWYLGSDDESPGGARATDAP